MVGKCINQNKLGYAVVTTLNLNGYDKETYFLHLMFIVGWLEPGLQISLVPLPTVTKVAGSCGRGKGTLFQKWQMSLVTPPWPKQATWSHLITRRPGSAIFPHAQKVEGWKYLSSINDCHRNKVEIIVPTVLIHMGMRTWPRVLGVDLRRGCSCR